MIREVHKIVNNWSGWYDKYVVYYTSGRKREFYRDKAPKTVLEFIQNATCEYVTYGNYFKYITKRGVVQEMLREMENRRE